MSERRYKGRDGLGSRKADEGRDVWKEGWNERWKKERANERKKRPNTTSSAVVLVSAGLLPTCKRTQENLEEGSSKASCRTWCWRTGGTSPLKPSSDTMPGGGTEEVYTERTSNLLRSAITLISD